MLIVLIIAGMILLVMSAALWPEPEDPGPEPAVTAATAEPERDTPRTLEGALTHQLLTGEISREQYRAEQARLAVRDAERHPFVLPDDRR